MLYSHFLRKIWHSPCLIKLLFKVWCAQNSANLPFCIKLIAQVFGEFQLHEQQWTTTTHLPSYLSCRNFDLLAPIHHLPQCYQNTITYNSFATFYSLEVQRNLHYQIVTLQTNIVSCCIYNRFYKAWLVFHSTETHTKEWNRP